LAFKSILSKTNCFRKITPVVKDSFIYLTLMLLSSGHETFLFMGILNLRMTRCGWLQITQRRAAIPKRCIIRGMLSKQE
jgi:hypothetical protein